MDGAKGSGANAQDYDFQRWFETIQKYEGKAAGYEADAMLFGAEAYTGVHWIGNESGYSNEQTWAKAVANKDRNTLDTNRSGDTAKGWSNGNIWTVPEADSKITSGWFWGTSKKTPASMEDLPRLQLAILRNQSRYVKRGGVLLYSTCTLLRRENEDVVAAFLSENDEFYLEPLVLPAPFPKNENGMLTLVPGEYDTDGFFISRLRRKL